MADQESTPNHYDLLKVEPAASSQVIRRAYLELSKLYHPDTTQLAPAVATEKFQHLNEAYATLSNPEKRLAYDYSIGISRISVMQAPAYLNQPASERRRYEKSNAYLDPTDRALSPGEVFALFILGLTFVGCLVLVFAISWTKGDIIIHTAAPEPTVLEAAPSPSSSEIAAEGASASPSDWRGLETKASESLETVQEAVPDAAATAVPETADGPLANQNHPAPLLNPDLSLKMI